MKYHQLKLTLTTLITVVSLSSWAQKPKINVHFEVTKGTAPLYLKYISNIDSLETASLDILMSGLRKYIGFADFTTEDSALKLNINLTSKFKESDLRVREYYLVFHFVNAQNDTIPHEWLFLDQNEYASLIGNNIHHFLEVLQRDWENYLFINYNNELVSKIFGKIPFNIPDGSHSYIHDRGSDKVMEFILPFRSNQLKIDKNDSEFKIAISYLMDNSTPTDMVADGAKISGEVDTVTMEGIPIQLMGCIRLGSPILTNITIPNFQSAEVFITQYRIRKEVQEDCASLDCEPQTE